MDVYLWFCHLPSLLVDFSRSCWRGSSGEYSGDSGTCVDGSSSGSACSVLATLGSCSVSGEVTCVERRGSCGSAPRLAVQSLYTGFSCKAFFPATAGTAAHKSVRFTVWAGSRETLTARLLLHRCVGYS